MSLLQVTDLNVRFTDEHGVAGAPVVRDLSFSLAAGETLALVGESGSGKSTTGFAILGLLPVQAEVSATCLRIGDIDLLHADEKRMQAVRGGHIGMVFQDALSALHPLMTIGDQVAEAVRLHQQVSKAEARAKALILLKRVRIPEAERRMAEYPHRLSGGMRQRVVIAIALAGQPDILIADEPTTALDMTVQAQILALLRDLQDETGMAILLITHDLSVVAEMADRVMVMRHGECIEAQSAIALFNHPQHFYTRQLMASRPLSGGSL
ncbi:ABC transporter ATP-binding protein [Glaciimonas sp. PCH181]|uniref:ATP-binding cassette domain-containing protein n=1 Tax=Glaciimonas sp. PCH181 TaxID=2133943 RepID=UPI00191C6719|nr:ABC transporter ATP-binding protein [Glaciimonas sp. PCH181]